MNPIARSRPAADANLDELIDLLADDALDAQRRAALLRSLDAAPDHAGWRRCALALLEARAWQRAMGDAPDHASWKGRTPDAERRSALFPRLAVAAVIAAFAAGILLGAGGWRRLPPVREVTQVESSLQRPSEAPAEGGLIAHGGPKTGADVRPAILPDYMRRQLEREGYQVQGGGSKLIPVELPDGRRVAVPVETLKYQYVGRQVR